MDREHVIAILRRHEPQLKAAGVVHLSLFGSTARGDRRADSDIDLLAVFTDRNVYRCWISPVFRWSYPRCSDKRWI